METLIIYAHPKTKGYCPEIMSEVLKQLKIRGLKYDVIDLYKIKYDPVLHEKEHYTAGGYDVSKQNKEFQSKIKKAKKLIFIYPIWWASMPAILKGFIDRVFVGRFAFTYVNGVPKGLLKGRKAAIFTTSGAPKFFSWLFQGGSTIKGIKNMILGFCGIKSKVFQLGSAQEYNSKRKGEIRKLVKKGLDYLY